MQQVWAAWSKGLAGVLLAWGLCALTWGQTKNESPTVTTPTAIKLPSGAVIIVTDKVGEYLQKTDSVVLSPEKFKELTDQIETLKKQLANEKPLLPSECQLEGKVEQRGSQFVVHIKAIFKVETRQPRTTVLLGCQKTQPIEAKFDDGKMPLLSSTDGVLSVLLENPGPHTIRLELDTPLLSRGSRGNEVGFEMGLPGAPITTLSFATPDSVKRVNVGWKKSTSPTVGSDLLDVERLQPGKAVEALGPITQLDLYWEDTSAVQTKAATRSVEANIQVSLSDTEIINEAKLTLRGTAKEWRILAPATAELAVARASADPQAKATELPFDQLPTIIRPEPNQQPIWKLIFKETNPADLLVTVNTRSIRPKQNPKSKSGYAIGPFAVLDVSSQTGVIRIKTPSQIRFTPILRGDTRRFGSTDDPNAEAVFRYQSLPTGANNLPTAPLELDIRTVPGIVQTSIQHRLQQLESGWILQSEMQIQPIRTEIDKLEIEVPSLNDLQEPAVEPASLVEGITQLRETKEERRVLQIKLLDPKKTSFSLTFKGIYPIPSSNRQAVFHLPRFLNTVDQTNQITITTMEGIDLKASVQTWDPAEKPGQRVVLESTPNGWSATLGRSIAILEANWKTIIPSVRMESLADITMGDTQARVSQQTRLTFLEKSTRKWRLRLASPNDSIGNFTVSTGSLEQVAPGEWLWQLAGEPGKPLNVKIQYVFPIRQDSQSGNLQSIPLLMLEDVQENDIRIRFWREPNATRQRIPASPNADWQQLAAEIVPERDSLPLLVVQRAGPLLPLTVDCTDSNLDTSEWKWVHTWMDRGLIQTQLFGGGQRYRSRFVLRKWLHSYFEVGLPMNTGEWEIFLNGKLVEAREQLVDADRTRWLRLALPPWQSGEALLLEVRYQIPELPSWNWNVQPCRFRTGVLLGPMRWQLEYSARSTPLVWTPSIDWEEQWGFLNGVPVPQSARSISELERWLMSGQEPISTESRPWEVSEFSLTGRQIRLAPWQLILIPRTLWLICGSILTLFLGLLISRFSRKYAWIAAIFLTGLLVIFSFIVPQILHQLMAGILPGLVCLFAILLFQQYLYWRYRWRVNHVPAFSQARNSSFHRSSQSRPILRETSTIDAPPVQPEPWASS